MAIHWKIIIGLILGIVWAFVSSIAHLNAFTEAWIAPFGTIFLNLLKLIAVPLVLFSVIQGICNLSDIKRLKSMGLKTLGIYLFTTVFAVSIGLILVNIIKPGQYLEENQRIENRLSYEIWAQKNNIPLADNKIYLSDPKWAHKIQEINPAINTEKLLENAQGLDYEEKIATLKDNESKGPLGFVVDMVPSNLFVSLSSNKLMLQIIFFAVFFGITLLLLEDKKTKPLIAVIEGLNEVFLKMVEFIMLGAPFFVFALMAGKLGEIAGDNPEKIWEILTSLLWYSMVVLMGLLLMVVVVYPGILKLFVKKISFGFFFKNIGPAQSLAFSSSSSAATLPLTLDCVTKGLKVPSKISHFVLPIGATVNMDGTSLYQAVAVIFLAQIHMIDLGFYQQITIVLTATLASIGSAAVPSAGLVMLMIVLNSVGLNPAWIAIIFPVDRILDMCRTVVNVTGDAMVSVLIAHSEKELKE